MRIDDFLNVLGREGELLIAAAGEAGFDAPVPTCPEWRVRDLVLHQGQIHRWATGFVAERLTGPRPPAAEELPDAELGDWFRAGHKALLAALTAAPDDLECWTFLRGSPTPRHFWARRQAHETAVHRMDAELAARGRVTPVAAEFAADGIGELLTGIHGRSVSRVRGEEPRTLRIRATDAPAVDWTMRISNEPPVTGRSVPDAAVDCEISGPVAVLYPVLWNRLPYGPEVAVTGDAAVAELWRAGSAVG
ncbi:maleylpyruvate isomerase family mycothiol-dependent enzyme [Streptomyces litchfieldiae]|uniref:Maleylpyruvate isomerase family mycothiol-dependent enzyme n=1 Tax=Streptomyces litchfieldiae TaxID=3075543 RepID=A0ABU2MZX4_9ACTN|nr:maleylpyruvate isomerase family mycothiol-dependent enzyme [Streptomyces sp. DSM 44938]MDT0347197.1 maleylpyruvate isomerase family mycothiol-dependent enzyme [Streptomyces sp. DSM 44938]